LVTRRRLAMFKKKERKSSTQKGGAA